MAIRMTNDQLLVEGKATEQWLKLGKDERKLLLREQQSGLCYFCGQLLPTDPSLFDLAREPGHSYSKNDYRDMSIAYVGHAAVASGCSANGHQGADHGNIPWFSQLAAVVQAREEIQRMRIRLGNRRLAIERGMDDPTLMPGSVSGLDEKIGVIEDALTADLEALMKKAEPIAQMAVRVLGVGPTTIARILAEIDISKARHASSLHKFAGFAPGFDRMVKGDKEDGQRQRGEKRAYNARLRVACRVQADSFLRTGISEIKKTEWPSLDAGERKEQWEALSWQSKAILGRRHGPKLYAVDYLDRRAQTAEQDKWKSDKHRHNDGLRIMMKMFLSHLWEIWRGQAGYPVSMPYPMTPAGGSHSGYISPQERGWPE